MNDPHGPRPPDPYRRPGDPAQAADRGRHPGTTGPILLMLVGVVAAVALVLVVATLAIRAVGDGTDAAASSVAPPPGGAGEPIRVGDAPSDVEIGDDGAVWTADRGSGTVTRVDPGTGETSSTTIGGEPTSLVVGPDRVWVWNYSSVLMPVGFDGRAGESVYLPADIGSIASDGTTVWYSQPSTGTVGRLDARSGTLLAPVRTGGRPDQIAVDGAGLVVLDADGSIRSVDTATGRSVAVPAPAGTTTVVAAGGRRYALGEAGVAELEPSGTPGPLRFGSLVAFDVRGNTAWVLDTAGVLHRLTPDLSPLGDTPGPTSDGGDLAAGSDGRLWVADTATGTVRAVRPG